MTHSRGFVLFLLVGFALLHSGCAGVRMVVDLLPAEDRITDTVVMEDDGARRTEVALIDVSGLLIDARRPGLISDEENPVARFVESLQRAEERDEVKAVIIRINSPGGTVTASEVMYDEVMRFRERTDKPVVMQMGALAASGGYYLACAGDEIIALPTTVTGSIGVVIQTVNVSEGLRRIGVHADAITSGPNKAMGTPLEPMEPGHRRLFQEIVEEFYAAFRAVVQERRPSISPAELEQVTDGRVVTGRRAAEAGLIDRTGGLRDAFAAAKARAGIENAKLVKYHRPLEYVGSAYSRAPSHVPAAHGAQVNLVQLNIDGLGLLTEPGFYYVWDPSAW